MPDGFLKFHVNNVAELEILLMHNGKFAAEVSNWEGPRETRVSRAGERKQGATDSKRGVVKLWRGTKWRGTKWSGKEGRGRRLRGSRLRGSRLQGSTAVYSGFGRGTWQGTKERGYAAAAHDAVFVAHFVGHVGGCSDLWAPNTHCVDVHPSVASAPPHHTFPLPPAAVLCSRRLVRRCRHASTRLL